MSPKEKVIISQKQTYCPSVSLDRIWEINRNDGYFHDYTVDEDLLYRKRHKIQIHNDLNIVALRTISGAGTLEIKNQSFMLMPDTVIFFKLQQPRKYYSNGLCWNFEWYEFKCDHVFFDLDKVYTCKRTKNEQQNTKKCKELIKEAKLHYASAIFLCNIFSWVDDRSYSGQKYADLMDKAIEYINKNYMNPQLSVNELSKYCDISVRLFRSEFKKHTNKTPIEYIIQFRIKTAQHLLTTTTLPIGEIAEKTGYNDPYIFSAAFKKQTSYSPSRFRQILTRT